MRHLTIQSKSLILRYLLIRRVIVFLAFCEYLNSLIQEAVADGKIIGEYTYNGKGQRIIKKTKSGDGDDGDDDDGEEDDLCKVFHYDQSSRLIEETACNGKFLVDYIYLNGNPLVMIRKQHHKEETFYYHNDHLDTPKVLTDKLKKIVWNVEFDPFGNELHKHGRHGQFIRKVKNNLRLPGQYFDKETGLHQNYFRDYDPETGTYPQSDPIGLLGGMNPYSYGNNPVNWIDPWGLQAASIPTPAGPLPIILPPNSQYNKLTPQQWEAMQKDINSFLRLFDPRPLVNYLNEKLIPTIQVPTGPKTAVDFSNTPESCKMQFEVCREGCNRRCESTSSKAWCHTKCWIAYLGCMLSNL